MKLGPMWPKEHPVIDRITSRISPNPYYDLDFNTPEINDQKAAETEVASLYYLSSISSLAEPKEAVPAKNTHVEASQVNKSWFSKSKDWLWNLFGIKSKAQSTEDKDDATHGHPIDNGAPQLETPSMKDQRRMLRTVADQGLVNRFKDIAEFEEEMMKSASNSLDKLIFLQLIACSLFQKELKEGETVNTQLRVLDLHQRNRNLRDEQYDLAVIIQNLNDKTELLHWTNLGLTGGIIGSLAFAYASGGVSTLVNIGMGMMSIGKGTVSLISTLNKKKSDHETGELFMVSQEHKHNAREIDEDMGSLVALNEEIAELLKTIRKHLDNQSRVERSFFGQNS